MLPARLLDRFADFEEQAPTISAVSTVELKFSTSYTYYVGRYVHPRSFDSGSIVVRIFFYYVNIGEMGKLIMAKYQEIKTVCGFFNFSNLQYLDLCIFESRQFWIFSTIGLLDPPIFSFSYSSFFALFRHIIRFLYFSTFEFSDSQIFPVLEYFNFPSSSTVFQSLDILTYEFSSSWISQLIMHLRAATSDSQAMINR